MLKNESFPALAAGFERKASMFIAKLIGWYRMWSRYEQGVRELSQLSDRELADIGVRRSELPPIAWRHAHRSFDRNRTRERPPLARAFSRLAACCHRADGTYREHEARPRHRRGGRPGGGRAGGRAGGGGGASRSASTRCGRCA